jgi:hypothetical protein
MGDTQSSVSSLDLDARALERAGSSEGDEVLPASAAPKAAGALYRLWVTMLRRKISLLVVVPAEPGTSGRAFAQELAVAGRRRGGQVRLVDAAGASAAEASRLADELRGQVERGEMVIATVDSVLQSDGGLPIVFVADATIIVVPLGVTALASIRATAETIGREHILGCVVMEGG